MDIRKGKSKFKIVLLIAILLGFVITPLLSRGFDTEIDGLQVSSKENILIDKVFNFTVDKPISFLTVICISMGTIITTLLFVWLPLIHAI